MIVCDRLLVAFIAVNEVCFELDIFARRSKSCGVLSTGSEAAPSINMPRFASSLILRFWLLPC